MAPFRLHGYQPLAAGLRGQRVFIALARERLHRHFSAVFLGNGLLFASTSVACFLIGQQIPFNPLEMAWSARQLIYLLSLYLLLAVPFFAVANCIGLALSRFGSDIPRIYGCDLLGGGLGCLAVVLLLFMVPPLTALYWVGATGLIGTAAGLVETRLRPRWLAFFLLVAGLSLPVLLHYCDFRLRFSPYKGLEQTLEVMGTEVVAEKNSPLGLLTVVRSPVIPFRYAPGLSLNSRIEPPPQLALFTDGGGMSVICRNDEQSDFTYLDYITSALPYHLLDRPRVLILGAGGGADVLQARFLSVAAIDGVELNPQVAELVNIDFGEFSGHLYRAGDVQLHIGEARGFVARSQEQYDLIQVALLDGFSASAAGLYALSESYVYTVEALRQYIEHLQPNGFLAITRWLKLPPRDSLKLAATADRPYFFHFFKWRTLPEFLSLRARGGLPLLEQGYLILIATLAQAVVASIFLILLPLWLGKGRGSEASVPGAGRERFRVLVYFFSLGLAFLFIEMAFIQKFILFLSHPLYAVGVVIAGFLLFAGLGSTCCGRLSGDRTVLVRAVAGICVLALLYLALLPVLCRQLIQLPDPVKVVVTLLLIAPLGFCMGMPFPLGLARLSGRAPGLVPWAWGINGCASVISAILATLLATHFGFSMVVGSAACLYLLALAVYPKREDFAARLW